MIYLPGVVVSLIVGLVVAPLLQAREENRVTLSAILVALGFSAFSWLALVFYLLALIVEFDLGSYVIWKKPTTDFMTYKCKVKGCNNRILNKDWYCKSCYIEFHEPELGGDE